MTLSSDRFVGRAEVLGDLRVLVERACSGRGALALVSGPAGIGKSRLCAELARRAPAAVRVVATACWTHGGAPPLWPWPDVLRRLGAGGDPPPGLPAPDRFAFFEAIVERLRAETARHPLVLVLDDLHAADEGTLLAARFAVRHLADRRLLVVGAARAPAAPGGREGILLDELAQAGHTLHLAGLTGPEVAELTRAEGRPADPETVAVLAQLTAGNPLVLRSILRAAPPGPLTEALPRGVREALARRLRATDAAVVATLARAALLGPVYAVDEVAAVCGIGVAEAEGAGRAGRALDVLRDDGGRLVFAHDLVREALAAGLDAGARQDVHGTAARVLAAHDPTAAGALRAAHHALRVAGRSAADRDSALARAAGAAAGLVAEHAFAEADELLTGTVAVARATGDGRVPARLLIDRARAVMLAGRVAEAHERFTEALDAAEAGDDPVAVAEAAAGLGGPWANNVREPVEQQRILRRQRAARARLPAGHEGLDLRLRSRIAAGAAFWERAPLRDVLTVIDDARRSADPAVRLEVLVNVHATLLGPRWAPQRRQLAEEMTADAAAVGHGIHPLLALCWRAVGRFVAADPDAERALADLRAPAEALQCTSMLYVVRLIEVTLAIRAGRLAEAEARAEAAAAVGRRAQDANTAAFHVAQLMTIRWFQGRDGELVELVEQVAAGPDVIAGDPSFVAAAAMVAARAGQPDRARCFLHRLTDDGGLRRLPHYSTWLASVCAVLETAAVLGDADTARAAYDLALPYAALPVTPSLAVTCFGPAHRFLGVAARAFGDLDAAADHLAAAVDAAVRLGHRPAAALARAELADLWTARRAPGDEARAAALRRRAAAERDELGLGHRPAGGRHGAAPPAADPRPVVTVVPAEGGGWTVSSDGDHHQLADRAGLRHLARLLRAPDQPIAALDLAAGAPGGLRAPVRQPVLDEAAGAALRDRAVELAAAIAEARDHGHHRRQEQLEDELDALSAELRRCAAHGGRVRPFADESERARTAVRKAIVRAIAEIEAVLPAAGAHLRATVSTGAACAYRPGAGDR